MSINNSTPAIPLLELAQTPEYLLRVMTLIDAIHRAIDEPELLELLQSCTDAMGATASVYLVAIPEDNEQLSLQVLLVCDPEFAYQHAQSYRLLDHPWVRYGRDHDLPIASSQLTADNLNQHAAVTLAREHGFASALIVPTPSAAGLGRFGLLCLGSAASDDFEHSESHVAHLLARCLATALFDWFVIHSRDALTTLSCCGWNFVALTPSKSPRPWAPAAGRWIRSFSASNNVWPAPLAEQRRGGLRNTGCCRGLSASGCCQRMKLHSNCALLGNSGWRSFSAKRRAN
jgi:Autoinducer binding domain